LQTGAEVVLDSGYLARAVRANKAATSGDAKTVTLGFSAVTGEGREELWRRIRDAV